MSNIIKGGSLKLTKPRLIELSGIGTVDDIPDPLPSAEINAESIDDMREDLQRESQKVLQETEAMIVDLLEKAREEARAIITAAREEAELMQIQAQQAADEVKQQAFQDGYRQGLEQANLEMADLKSQAQYLVEEARAEKLKTIKECEGDILRLAMAIARKVVTAELRINPDAILSVIQESIALLDNPDNVTVHVNPAELNHVLKEIGSTLYSDANQEDIKVKVIPDNSITAGGCTVESEVGMIDARLETRLDNMEQLMQELSGDD